MAHIGIQGLTPGHAQDHGTQKQPGAYAIFNEKADAIHGVQGKQDAGVLHYLQQTQQGDAKKPNQHDGAEYAADFFSTEALT
jgi:hypothetical protein